MTYSEPLADFLKGWEGLKLVPSGDPLVPGVRDVGYGHVLQPDEQVRPITLVEADELLRWDLHIVGDEVDEVVTTNLAQNQFDALLSWTYNLGVGALAKSTLLRCINGGLFDAAADEFGKWVFAGGHEAPGLVKRRAAEREMFADDDYSGRP